MPIEFRCTQCGQPLRVADSSAGKGARCPGCKSVMTVPAASDLSARSLTPLASPPPAPTPAFAPPPPAAPSPQDDLFAYLKQAVTPSAPPPPQPAPYQRPGVLGDSPYGAAPTKSVSGTSPADANPYASPPAAYPALEQPPGERPGLPWEVKGIGLASWWETSQLCLGDAERAFGIMRQDGGMGSPMLYAIWGLLIGFLGQMVWSVPGMMLEILGGRGQGNNQLAGMGIMLPLMIQGAATLVYATVWLLFSAAVTHLCLILVGGARQGYETTYRVVAFSAGSIAWLNVIPCFGPLIVLVMSFVCPIQGLAAAHGVSVGKAAAAVLLPMLFCVGLGVIGFVALIAVIVNQ